MATTQNFNYPSSSDVTITGIGNPIGQPYPTTAVAIAGDNPEGILTPVAVTDGGAVITSPAAGSVQHVIVDSSALPTGASTSSLQTSGNASLTTIASNTTGLATQATLSTVSTTLGSILLDLTNGTQITQVSNFPATQPVSGTVAISQVTPGTTNGVVVNSSALPTGAATSALQTTGNTSLATIATNTTVAATAALQSSTQGAVTPGTIAIASTLVGGTFNNGITLTSGQQAAIQLDANGRLIIAPLTVTSTVTTKMSGRQITNPPVINQYSTTPVTTTAYTTLLASVGGAGINFLDIFDSSGQAMILATGAAGSEVPLAYIPPGGDQILALVTSGTRLSIKALTANATAGYILANFWN